MKLEETKELMCSLDYKERFKAEYYQLKIRYEKLKYICDKWDNLEFIPTCPKEIYDSQLLAMEVYLDVLKQRAEMENIEVE